MSDKANLIANANVYPLISEPWQRDAIMEVVDYWKENAVYNGTVRNAAIAARRLLWMLPESRNGKPIRNPINGRPVRRPKDSRSFRRVIGDCSFWDSEVRVIVAKHEFNNDQEATDGR